MVRRDGEQDLEGFEPSTVLMIRNLLILRDGRNAEIGQYASLRYRTGTRNVGTQRKTARAVVARVGGAIWRSQRTFGSPASFKPRPP